MAMCDNLARQLNEIRKARGLSITEFAEELNISRSTLQSILLCNGNPRTDTIEHIAEKLQIDPVSLLAAPPDDQQISWSLQRISDQLVEKLREMLGEKDE